MNLWKERYLKRKAAGICVSCGTKDDRTASGKVLCQACTDRDKNHREILMCAAAAMRVCKYCGAKDEHTKAGFRFCSECAGKVGELKRKSERERRKRLAAEWRCTSCGAALPPDYEYMTCTSCRERQAQRKRKERLKS